MAVFGEGFGFPQDIFAEVEMVLGGVVAFGFAPVKLLPIIFIELEGLRGESEFFGATVVAERPAEDPDSQPLRRHPKSSSIEVEELESVASFVGQSEDGLGHELLAEMVGGDFSKGSL